MVKTGNKMPNESFNKKVEVLAEDLSKAKLVGADDLIPLMKQENKQELLDYVHKFLEEQSQGKRNAGESASSSTGTSTRASSANATTGSDAGRPVGDSGDDGRPRKRYRITPEDKENLMTLKHGT